MPLPRSRNTLPLCVSAGTRIFADPSSVGTEISPPSAAVVIEIGISQCRSSWSRVNTACGLMDLDVQVARRAAVHSRLAFAREPHAIALVYACRNLHRERLLHLDPA